MTGWIFHPTDSPTSAFPIRHPIKVFWTLLLYFWPKYRLQAFSPAPVHQYHRLALCVAED